MRSLLPLLFALTFATKVQSQMFLSFDSTYRVGKAVTDSTLSANHGKIEFHFSSHSDYGDSIPCNTKVLFTCNNVLDSADYVSLTKPSRILSPGKYVFIFYVNDRYHEVATDTITITAGTKTPLYVNFNQPPPIIYTPDQISIDPSIYIHYSGQEDKPVIYIYPQMTTVVSIQLQLHGKLGFTYPAYGNGWNFTADPDGSIHLDGKTYPYLFWEGSADFNDGSINWNNGAVVSRDSLVPFFEKNLTAMGLNEKEITDYITYWVPRMQKNERSYIHFIMNDDYDRYASMNISPAPDSKLQVFMLWSDANGICNAELKPQHFTSLKRNGFTVVEWGGSELPSTPVIFEDFDQ